MCMFWTSKNQVLKSVCLFVVSLMSVFFSGCISKASEFTHNNQLNSFVKELYLEIPEGSMYKVSDLRLAQVARRCVKEGYWILSIRDRQGNVVSMFQAGSNGFSERCRLLTLTERNKSGIKGYAIVDWSVFGDNTNNYRFPDDALTSAASDLINSPTIRRFVNSEVLYVSSSEGDDSNLGISQNEPLQTISKALLYKKNIKLKCGDVFNGSITLSGVDMKSYGRGDRPIVSGWKRLKKNDATNVWQEGELLGGVWHAKKGTNIWRLDLDIPIFGGRKVIASLLNDIGLIKDNDDNSIHGRKCQYVYKNGDKEPVFSQKNTYLKNNFDFCQCSKKGSDGLKPEDFRYLYMYLDHNPSEHDLSFSTYGNGFNLSNSSVDGIRVEGFACHGFSCASDVKITNCDIEYIGGAQQIGYLDWVRFGNGVEFYVSSTRRNGYVADNIIRHTFDCATTVQASNFKDAWAENIVFKNNAISNCRQAFEHFLNNTDSKTGKMLDYVNCSFVDNVCVNIGDNGFSSPELRDACILSYERENGKSVEISGNIFFDANFYCAKNFSKNVHDNEVFLYNGQYLNHYHLEKKYPTITAVSSADVSACKFRVGNVGEVTILKRGSKEDLKQRKKVTSKLNR